MHRHCWKAIRAQYDWANTNVLYHCSKCGRNKTESIRGNWSLSDLLDKQHVSWG